MKTLWLFLFTFFIAFVGRFLYYLITKRKKNKKKTVPTEVKYLEKKFKIKKEKVDNKLFLLLLSLIDAFIIAVDFIFVVRLSNFILLQLVLGFVFAMAVIYLVYEILGKILVWKGYDK